MVRSKCGILLVILLLFAIGMLPACGGSSDSPSPASTSPEPTETRQPTPTQSGGQDQARCGDGVCSGPEDAIICPEDCQGDTAGSKPTPTPTENDVLSGTEEGVYRVTNPTSGADLYTTIITPDEWNGSPMPTLVFIPGGDDDSAGLVEGVCQQAADQGYVAVAFDADGRGNSGGEEDYNGHTHQDGLAAVVDFAADLPQVDAGRMGLISYSFGVTMASGALARHPDMPIRFYIEWEGPADRYDTTVGCKPSAHYDWPACDDDAAWSEREALTFISQIKVPYHRLQNQTDHVQSDVSHAVHMVNAAVAGASPWVRLNDYPPNQTYDPEDPPEMFPNRGGASLDERMLMYAGEMFDRR